MVDAGSAGTAGKDTGGVGLEDGSVGLNGNRNWLDVQGRCDGCSCSADLDIRWAASVDFGSGSRVVLAGTRDTSA